MQEEPAMSDLFWLTDKQMRRITTPALSPLLATRSTTSRLNDSGNTKR